MSSAAPRLLAVGALTGGACAAFYAAAERPIRRWGAKETDLRCSWPGDDLVTHPAYTWTNSVAIERPAAEVWPWLVQLGQGRGGLYSYDWLENLLGCDVHSVERLLPELQQPLAVGDRVIRMCRYAPPNPVARFEPGVALVLGDVKDSPEELAAGCARSSWAFIVQPAGPRASRLIVRSRGSSRAARAQGPFQFVMQRKTMLGIKRRAECASPSVAEDLEPALWLLAGGVFVAGSVATLVGDEVRTAPLAVAGAAAAVLPALMFWRPPVTAG
jgi:hypothetical protein